MASDGTFSTYCNEYPALFGVASTVPEAKMSLEETLRLVKEECKESAAFYPTWLEGEYSFWGHWDSPTILEFYQASPANGRLLDIN